MKTLIATLVTAAVLAGTAGAGLIHRPQPKPRATTAHVLSCAPRIDGIDGYLCAETRAGGSTVVATVLFAKNGDRMLGVRKVTTKRTKSVNAWCHTGSFIGYCYCIEWWIYPIICKRWIF